jgi:hypothetical protein
VPAGTAQARLGAKPRRGGVRRPVRHDTQDMPGTKGWDRAPFTSSSQSQVAVFEKLP